MRRRSIKALALVATIGLFIWFCIFLAAGNVKAADALTPSIPLSSTSTSSLQSNNGSNILFQTLLDGLVGALITTAVAIGIAIHQNQHNKKSEREKIRFQDEIAAARAAQERERERKEAEAETAQSIMRRAEAISKYVQTYRKVLHRDPHIARLQILDMSQPLEVINIYIRVRLHQEFRSNYQLDSAMYEAERDRDPNELLKASQLRLESRSNAAIDPDEAIRKYKHCVIVGDPGAGKTTLLKYLTLKAIDNQLTDLPDLPIHIELNAFTNSGHRDLLEFAASIWEKRYSFPKAEALDYIKSMLQEGKAILLLDALDETVTGKTKEESDESYRRVVEAITELATCYHESPIVVTARKAGYHQRKRLTGFIELEVLDFRPEDIKQFVNKWFACHSTSSTQANDLNAQLERNPRIHTLAANPLLLSLIVIVYEAQQDLPDCRAALYRECIDTLLTKWDANRDIRRRREFQPEHKRQLLKEVAWHFHLQRERYFSEDELLNVIADFLPAVGLLAEQNRQILEEISTENGLLKEQAQGWYGFLHLTLQEFFSAQYAADHHQLDKILLHRGDPWWEEVTLLYAGYTADASSLLKKLLGYGYKAFLREDIFYTNLILAGRCLAGRPTVRQSSLRKVVISRLFDILMKTPYSLTKQHVIDSLAEIGGNQVNKRLLDLLSEVQIDQYVREYIPYALGKLGERSVAPDLLKLLFNKQIDSIVRWAIPYALGELGERSVIPDLLRLLSSEQIDSEVQSGIPHALGKLGGRSVAPDLLKLLSNEQVDSKVQWAIVEVLGELGERSVAPNLLRLLYNKQIDSGMHIAEVLGKLGEHSMASDLLRLLSHEQIDPNIRSNIAAVLGKLGERSVATDLLELISNRQIETEVRKCVADALGELGEHSVAPELLQLLLNRQIELSLRERIVNALGKLGERSVATDLLRLLSNQQVELVLRARIADALGKLGEHSIIPELVRLAKDTNIDIKVRMHVAEALGDLGVHSVARGLLQLLSNPQIDQYEQRQIVSILGKLGERSVVTGLLQLLINEHTNPYIHESIADALSELGDRNVVPDLLQLLSNQQFDLGLRQRIAYVLGTLADDESTVYALAKMQQQSDITDDIHRVLWQVSRRAGMRVFMTDQSNGKKIELVKWGDEHKSNKRQAYQNRRYAYNKGPAYHKKTHSS